MDARYALRFARRWLPLLLAGPLLGALASLVIVRQIPAVYEAQVILLVEQGSVLAGTGFDDPRSSEGLARTYAEMVRTRPVLEAAAREVGLTAPPAELQRLVSARLVRETQLLRITVEHTNPELAAAFANAVADTFVARTVEAQASRFASSRESLARLVDSLREDVDRRTRQVEQLNAEPSSPARDAELARQRSELAQVQTTYGASLRSYEELRIVEARGTNRFSVLEPAIPPKAPVRPAGLPIIVLAILGGLGVAVALAAAAEYLDDRLRDRRRVAVATGLATLGLIPPIEPGAETHSPLARRGRESFQRLLINLRAATADEPMRTLMVTSAGGGEGKSTTALSLAVFLAKAGQRVILVDADLHGPSLSRGTPDAPGGARRGLGTAPAHRAGLASLLANEDEAVAAALQATAVPGLQVLPSGPPPPDPSALFSRQLLARRVEELAALCDVVVFDSPALLAVPDAALIGPQVDTVLFIVDATRSRGRAAARAVEMLHQAGAPVVGAVLNRASRDALDLPTYPKEARAEDPGPSQDRPAAPADRFAAPRPGVSA